MPYRPPRNRQTHVECAVCGERKLDICHHEHARTLRTEVEQWKLCTSFDAVVCSETCRKTLLMRLKAQGWLPYFEEALEPPDTWGPQYLVALLGPGADIDRPRPDEPLARVVQY